MTPLAIDVRGGRTLRGWLCIPDEPATRRVLVYCLAGGSCSTSYFDLEPAGYSMARHLSAQGLAVAALDHPGIGDSSPVDDLFALTPGIVAAAHGAAVDELRRSFGPFSTVVGVGHSMGGMLAEVQQARHRSFDGLAVLGVNGAGLPEVLTEAELEGTEPLADLARRRFGTRATVERRPPARGAYFAADVPAAARAAFGAQRTALLPTCGLAAIIPGTTDRDAAEITVPVLLAFGEHDFCTDLAAGARRYRSAPTTVYELPGSGHCHNLAGRRAELWDRISAFALAPPARCTASGPG